MLTNPPCNRIFVGCSTDDFDASSTGDSSLIESESRTSRRPIIGSSQGSSSSRSSTFGSNLTDNLSTAPQPAERIAEYTISTVNRGAENIKNLVLSHGPIPSDAIFDNEESGQNCSQVGQVIECRMDLNAGESKDVVIAYKSSNSISCALTRAFQTVKSTVNGIAGSATNGISTSVSCAMKTSENFPTAASAISSSASFSSVALSGTEGLGGPVVGSTNGNAYESGNGYKSEATYMPQAGAMDIIFSSTKDYVLVPANTGDFHGFFSSSFLVFTVVAGIFLAIAKRKIFV